VWGELENKTNDQLLYIRDDMTEWNVLKCKQNHAIDEGNEYCNIFM